jgi:hypothetical protein
MNFLMHITIISQPVYFNNTYPLGDPGIWSGSLNLTECDSGYVICGKTGINIGIKKIDYNGNDMWSKVWGDSIANWYVGYPGSLKSVGNNYFISGSKNYYTPYSHDVGLVMKLNNEWDTIWSRDYNFNLDNDPDTSIMFNQMDICFNGDLILGGGMFKSSTVSFTKFMLTKMDTSGNILWYNTYSYSERAFNVNDGYSVIQTSDSGFALGGFWYVIGSSNYTGDPIIVKTDSLGNEEWMMNLGGPYEDNRAWLCRANDGNILVGTVIADSATTSHGGSYLRINIIKLDNEGNVLWDKKYGHVEYGNYLSNIHCMEDGSIICTGSIWTPQTWDVGWILKLNPNGDSLWYRKYYNISGQYSSNYLKDIILASDSGFVACGYVFPVEPDTGIERAWVLKVDSIGCDTAGCDPTVGIVQLEPKPESNDQIVIYPNPASDRVKIRFSEENDAYSQEKNVEIYSIFGITVKEVVIPTVSEYSINVQDLPIGIYLLNIRAKGRIIASMKLMISR